MRSHVPDRPRAPRGLAFGATVTLVLVASGCYAYVPASFETTAPGRAVRIDLVPRGTERLRDRLGIGPVRIDGQVASVSPGQMTLTPHALAAADDLPVVPGYRIDLIPEDVDRLQVRVLDRPKTLLFAGGVAAAVGLSFYLAEVYDPGGGPDRPPGGDFIIIEWTP